MAHQRDSHSEKLIWLTDPSDLPFDHENIVNTGLAHLKTLLWKDIELTSTILTNDFSTQEVIQIGSPTPLKSNIGRWLRGSGVVENTNTSRKTENSGRPATVWRWNGEAHSLYENS